MLQSSLLHRSYLILTNMFFLISLQVGVIVWERYCQATFHLLLPEYRTLLSSGWSPSACLWRQAVSCLFARLSAQQRRKLLGPATRWWGSDSMESGQGLNWNTSVMPYSHRESDHLLSHCVKKCCFHMDTLGIRALLNTDLSSVDIFSCSICVCVSLQAAVHSDSEHHLYSSALCCTSCAR